MPVYNPPNTPYLNAKDYGVRGDNVADDRAALQSLITYAASLGGAGYNVSGNATIFLPRGTYKIGTAGLDFTGANKVNFIGEGMMVTMLNYTGTGSCISGIGTLASPDGPMLFQGMSIYGNAGALGHGIDLTYVNPSLKIIDIYVSQFTDGIRLSNCFEATLDNVYCDANRSWGINLFRNNDSTTLYGCAIANNLIGGIRVADGYQGPIVGAWVYGNPIGILIENSAQAGSTADYGFTAGAQIIGGTIEGGATQTQGLKVQTAVATLVEGLSISGLTIINGTGTLCSLSGADRTTISQLYTQGSGAPATGTHLDITATCTNTIILGLQQRIAAAETLINNAGTNSIILDKDGFTNLKSYTNLNVYLAKGDANPQIGLTRDGTPGAGGALVAGPGGGVATDIQFGRDTTGRWFCQGVLRLNTVLTMDSTAAAGVPINSMFRDSADNKLKYKDNAGVVNLLY